MGHAFGVISKILLQYPRLSRYSPMLSSRCLIIFFACKSMMYFVSIFVKDVRFSFSLHIDVQLFQHFLLKKLFLLFSQRSVDYSYVGLLLGSLFFSSYIFFHSLTNTTVSRLLLLLLSHFSCVRLCATP